MTPVEFDTANLVIAKDQPPYLPLPAQMFGDNQGTMLTCWELSEEEIAQLVTTRKIWVTTLTFNQLVQPLCLSVERPVAEVVDAPEYKL